MEVSRDHTILFLPFPLGGGWGEGGFCELPQLFGDKLNTLINKLNETLAA